MNKQAIALWLPVVLSAVANDASATEADTSVVALREVEIMANRATAKVPVAFNNILKADIRNSNTLSLIHI